MGDGLAEYASCSICRLTCGSVFNCENGHVTCLDCCQECIRNGTGFLDGEFVCSVCRRGGWSRNLLVERIVSESGTKVDCSCGFSFPPSEIDSHRRLCRKDVCCPFECHSSRPLTKANFLNHITSFHSQNVLMDDGEEKHLFLDGSNTFVYPTPSHTVVIRFSLRSARGYRSFSFDWEATTCVQSKAFCIPLTDHLPTRKLRISSTEADFSSSLLLSAPPSLHSCDYDVPDVCFSAKTHYFDFQSPDLPSNVLSVAERSSLLKSLRSPKREEEVLAKLKGERAYSRCGVFVTVVLEEG